MHAGHNNPPFDFVEFVRGILMSSASTAQKLMSVSVALKAHDGGGRAAPRRSEILHMASISEATFKRSYGVLKVFFEMPAGGGQQTNYVPKPFTTPSEIETAICNMTRKKRCQNDTREPNIGCQNDTTLKKEIPPTPPKEKNNNIYTPSQPSSRASAKAGVGEVEGINGATSLIVNKLAGWINPMMPDHRTARGWLESSVAMYGGVVVRDSFAELEAKVLQGDVIARPIPLLTRICQRRKADPPGQVVDKRMKGLPEQFRRDIEAKRGPR
jgi:hypothetical protein